MGIEPLGRRSLGVLRHRIGRMRIIVARIRALAVVAVRVVALRIISAAGRLLRCTIGRRQDVQRRPGVVLLDLLALLLVVTPAETDRRQTLQQRQAALLGMLGGVLSALLADLVLRRDRQLVDPRHSSGPRDPLGRRWNKGGRRFLVLHNRFAGIRLREQ